MKVVACESKAISCLPSVRCGSGCLPLTVVKRGKPVVAAGQSGARQCLPAATVCHLSMLTGTCERKTDPEFLANGTARVPLDAYRTKGWN